MAAYDASLLDTLSKAFSPPLDSSLVAAIANDFPSTPEGEASARAVLEPLAADAHVAEKEAHEKEVARAFEAWSLDERGGPEGGASTASASESTGSDATVDFLRSIFPHRSPASLREKIQEVPDAGGDVSSVVESLLTEDYLSASSRPPSATSSPTLSDSATLAPTPSATPRRKARRKRDQAAARGQQTISLTDVLHTDLKRRHAAAASASASEDEGDNRWVTLDSQASYIGQLLDVSPGHVTSAYHSANSNLILGLDRLMATLTASRSRIPDGPPGDAERATHESAVCELQLGPPHGPPRSEAELLKLSHLTRADAAAARDLVAFLDSLAVKHGSVSWNSLTQSDDPTPLPPPRTRLASSADLAGSALAHPTLSSTEYLELATTYRNQRNLAFRSAATAFQASRSHGGLQGSARRGEAAYWAEEGRTWDAKMKKMEMMGARASVEERKGAGGHPRGPEAARATADGGTVDLHGLTVNQALTITKEQVNAWWSSGSNPAPLLIVTGAGRHSHNSNPILLPAVAKLLEREGWLWKYDAPSASGLRGAIVVKGVKR